MVRRPRQFFMDAPADGDELQPDGLQRKSSWGLGGNGRSGGVVVAVPCGVECICIEQRIGRQCDLMFPDRILAAGGVGDETGGQKVGAGAVAVVHAHERITQIIHVVRAGIVVRFVALAQILAFGGIAVGVQDCVREKTAVIGEACARVEGTIGVNHKKILSGKKTYVN